MSALSGVKVRQEMVWIGTAGSDLSKKDLERSRAGGFARFVPIHVEEADYDAYYNGISNNVFWPSFHYQSQYVDFSWDDWDAYRRVNRLFAETIMAEARPGDRVWIHDFHLFLVPGYLRELGARCPVGFFLHIPFPTSEIFRELPVREEVLDSLLGADLVGFHDNGYLNHFLSAARRVGGVETSLLGVRRGKHTTRLGVFPVSIDTPRYARKAAEPRVARLVEEFRIGGPGHRVALGVDRLDYAKGIDLKLRAFRAMLRNHPELRGKVTLIQLAVPTRQRIANYQRLRSRVEMLVGEINGEFGRPNHTPVKYLYDSVSFETLLALYRLANVMVVASKRDGMNLVCQEYVAAQDPADPGVLLLSEFAGAISTLPHAVSINPWDTERTGEKIAASLAVGVRTRRKHHAEMLRYLEAYTATEWATSFMQALDLVGAFGTPPDRLGRAETIDPEAWPPEMEARIRGRPVLLMTDYDGTLVQIRERPEQAVLPRATRRALVRLIRTPGLRLVTVSGRARAFLTAQFGDLPISLGAEHGARYYDPGRGRWLSLVHSDRKPWMGTAIEVIRNYAMRVPGSFVERKTYSVGWHYRSSPEEFAENQSRKLREELQLILADMPVSVLQGKKVIEVRAAEANKGHFVRWLLHTHPLAAHEVVIAVGDDETDEEMFAALGEAAVTIRVGPGTTSARYRIERQAGVLHFLRKLGASS